MRPVMQQMRQHAVWPAVWQGLQRLRWLGLRALCGLWLACSALAAFAAETTASADYVIGQGDVLRIAVFQSPDLSLEARVAESGAITYPLLGSVKLMGLTVAKAEQLLAQGLREGNFIKQPQVSINVLQIRGHQVSALGLLNRPGRYPLETAGMRLSELVAAAGGIAMGGSDTVTLNGMREGKPYRLQIDLPALLTQSQGEDPVLRHGDVVYVDRMATLYIYGEVQRPGPIRLEREMNVMQALATGGGITQRGTVRGMALHRKKTDGSTEILQPGMDDKLRDGDVIFVRESLF